jgi:membrane protease YdiL (CAAX protease family)
MGTTAMMEHFEENGQIKISGPLLVALHLVPGLIFAGVFFALSRLFIRWGLTGYLALLVAIPVCLVPVEIGVMLLWGARTGGRNSLLETIGYRQRGTAVDYLVVPLFLFIFWSVLSIAVAPVSLYLETHLSVWLPAWATQASLIDGFASSNSTQQSITLGLAVILSGFVAPVVEELYFRGFLLPRMEQWGWAAPVVNSLLFAAYHFYFPGNVLGIFLAFVPISYVVVARKNWRIGVVVHCLFNLWGVYSLATFLR